MPTRDKWQELLTANGHRGDLVDVLVRIDAVAQNWRRRMHKRELGQRALKALDLDLDLAQLDALFAIAPPSDVADINPDDETMVSTVAERLLIDPSRASRIVSEMVNAGYARRAVSQRDARRTILELTPAGEAVVSAVRNYKWLLLSEFFAGWRQEDLDIFVPLLERYSDWLRTSEGSEDKFASEIADMTQSIYDARNAEASRSQSG